MTLGTRSATLYMDLKKDTTISHYRILSQIGKGGMGNEDNLVVKRPTIADMVIVPGGLNNSRIEIEKYPRPAPPKCQ